MCELGTWLERRNVKQLRTKLFRYSSTPYNSYCDTRMNGSKQQLVSRILKLALASDSNTFMTIFYDYLSLPSPYKSSPLPPTHLPPVLRCQALEIPPGMKKVGKPWMERC